MRKGTLISFIALALVSVSASAQTSEALPFTRIGADASREAMAGAGSVSSASAAWASYDNAALAAFSGNKLDAAATYNMWAPAKSNMFNGGATLRLGKMIGITAGATLGLGQPYDIYSSTGTKTGSFTPKQTLLNLGVGVKVLPWLSVGANFHSATETIAEKVSHGALSGDFTVMGNFNGIKVATGVVNLGTKVYSQGGGEFNLPTSAKIAAGYEATFADVIGVGAYADADYFIFSGGLGVSAGASVSYNNLACLRAGYHFGNEKCFLPSYASAGLGGQFMGIHLDVAALFGGVMSGTIMVTAGYRF